MTAQPNEPSAEQRIRDVLATLGIERAHFAARVPGELSPIIAAGDPLLASLTLVDPVRVQVSALAALGDRLQIVAGDQGMSGLTLDNVRREAPGAHCVPIAGHSGASWSDTVAEHLDLVEESLVRFSARHERERPATALSLAPGDAERSGILYRVRGAGPALVLMPLALSPSQWEPAIDRLAAHFTVVVLGGPELGMVAMLEARAASPGYRRVVRSVIDELAVEPGQTVLDVGCGTGALDRWLLAHTAGEISITGVDLSPYLLREARSFAARAGLADAIRFEQGNAESLPFPDDTFDVAMSHTVMEECDADRMLAEMIRVTRPGGQVAVMVRAVDMPLLWNLPLPPELKARVEAPLPSVGEKGCADASLYRRFHSSPLTEVRGFPQFMAISGEERLLWDFYEPQALQGLSAPELAIWNAAGAEAAALGTRLFARPHHCAIGRKPV